MKRLINWFVEDSCDEVEQLTKLLLMLAFIAMEIAIIISIVTGG